MLRIPELKKVVIEKGRKKKTYKEHLGRRINKDSATNQSKRWEGKEKVDLRMS